MKIVTFGEVMLRLSPRGNNRLSQTATFDAWYGGSEANVGALLATLGHDVSFVSRFPENDLGDAALHVLRGYGLHTDCVARGGSRLGLYYAEAGSSVRPGKVIYDRAGSSFAGITAHDLDFDKIFDGVEWYHWSGITPALSGNAAEVQRLFLIEAKKRGVTVSCDLNYRESLWTPAQAKETMIPLMADTDVLIGNESHAQSCLGFTVSDKDGETELERAGRVCEELCRTYHFQTSATTFRRSFGASRNTVGAVMFTAGKTVTATPYDVSPIVDRIGSGDAFAGGLIHALSAKQSPEKALSFALAACALKHTVPGDVSVTTEREINELAASDGRAIFKR